MIMYFERMDDRMLIKSKGQRVLEYSCDLCIVGGGLSGMCAAISAAREGVKVVLIQDRPVLGGNASSEIRMWIRGAKGLHNRETGIVSEIEEENIYRNPTLNYSLWDTVLYEKVKNEKNIRLLLNCTCLDAETVNGSVKSVSAWQLTTYTFYKIKAKYFADCSGDSILAPITGALYRVGREGNSEFNETIGPLTADAKTMGMSCLIQAKETDHPVKFTPPEWAYVYETDSDFDKTLEEFDTAFYGSEAGAKQAEKAHKCTRPHTLETSGTNFWWLELGGEHDSIHDTEMLRDELLKIALGIWDHVKNRGDHNADNWELEWLGFLPGKRESRRYVGAHILTQNDVESEGRVDDIIAYGGWTMDDHNPAGFNAKRGQPSSLLHPVPSPYGIPYRSLYSKNISNLFFAGRNISATHAAMSSTRVMATCALIGQAMGTAASICINEQVTPPQVYSEKITLLQDKLRDAGCYIPFSVRRIPELSLSAKLNISDEDRAILFNGEERPDAEGKINYISLNVGDCLTYSFDEPTAVSEIRFLFDPDFSRKSVSVNKKMRIFAQKANEGLDFEPMKVAKTLVKSFDIYADGELVYSTDKCHNSRVNIRIEKELKTLSVKFNETWGEEKVHLFSCDVK